MLQNVGKLPDMQVCGVFALFLSGAHTLLFWGFLCRPRTRAAFICAYYLAAAACVAAGLRGRSALQVSPLIRYQIRHALCDTVYGPAQQSAGCKQFVAVFRTAQLQGPHNSLHAGDYVHSMRL